MSRQKNRIMKKTFLLVSLLLTISSINAQKILRSSYSEVYSGMNADPDVFQVTEGSAGSSSKVFVSFKNGDKYSFTFWGANNKLYGMTLVCSNDNQTFLKFNQENQRRKGTLQSKGSYLYYDEQGRGIYYWTTEDDLGRIMINWEAKFPFSFD